MLSCSGWWLIAMVGWYGVHLAEWLVAQPAPLAVREPADLSPQLQLPEVSNTARTHLARAQTLQQQGQWQDAMDAWQLVMDTEPEGLVPLVATPGGDGTFLLYLPAREYCQLQLAALAAASDDALRLYRGRADALAGRWWQEGKERADTSLLLRIADHCLASSYGDDALDRLAERALESGQFDQARYYWQRINPLLRAPSQPSGWRRGAAGDWWWSLRGQDWPSHWNRLQADLTEPRLPTVSATAVGSELTLADLWARLVLVSILEGSLPRAELEFALLSRLYPGARGYLRGREGAYAELLAELLEECRQWPSRPPDEQWPTFAGAATRNRVAGGEIDPAGVPLWTFPLPRRESLAEMPVPRSLRVAEKVSSPLSYFPVVVGDAVYVCRGPTVEEIDAIDLHSGRPLWPVSRPAEATRTPESRPRPGGSIGAAALGPTSADAWARGALDVPRYTLTARDGLLMASLGVEVSAAGGRDSGEALVVPTARVGVAASHVAVLDLKGQRKLASRLEEAADEGWAFEGTPLCVGGYVYAALRRHGDLRAQAHLACYDARRGTRVWLRWLGSAEMPGAGPWSEPTHNLLTWHEGVLYYNSNLGLVCAVRASDGQLRWMVTYPRAPFRAGDPDRDERHLLRDLNPCLVAQGIVVVAPADSDRIFALAADTGQLLWTSGPGRAGDVVHLLGVAQDHVIATGDFVYWMDVLTGRIVDQFPGPRGVGVDQARPEPAGYGRGLLAGASVYWPTREKIYVLPQRPLRGEAGWHILREIDLSYRGCGGGNLILAQDVLLVATADRLCAFDCYGPRRATAGPSRADVRGRGRILTHTSGKAR